MPSRVGNPVPTPRVPVTYIVPVYRRGLTKSPPKTIEERVYLVDIMETILNYLNISATHDRESISFKDLIEKNIDINKERSIRGDCYLMFQAAKRTMIIKDNWKLTNNNGIFSLHNLSEDLLEKKDVKEDFKQIYYELYDFYMKTEIVNIEDGAQCIIPITGQEITYKIDASVDLCDVTILGWWRT